MTNEEAIADIRDNIKPIVGGKSLDMAIKALEQQPCEDCISRQALIEKATSWDKHFADSERCVSLTDIQNAPSVTPQPKTLSDAKINTFVESMKNMRKATKEESKSTVEYIDSISKPTGFLFDEAYEELVFVEPHKKLSTNLQPCKDCISREAVIEHICEAKECYKEECKGRTLKRCPDLQWVFDLPSVTPQPKRGKWISVDDGGMCVDGYCSKCNIFIPKNVREILRDYCDGDFCPNCGADMRESGDKE